jgi:hypothetical protein
MIYVLRVPGLGQTRERKKGCGNIRRRASLKLRTASLQSLTLTEPTAVILVLRLLNSFVVVTADLRRGELRS